MSLRSGYLNRIPAAEIPEQSKLKTGYPLPKSPNNQVYSEGSLLCRSPILRKVLVKLSTTVKLLIKGRFREVPKRDRIPASGRPGSAKTPETSSERLPYLTEVLQGKYWLNSVQPSKCLQIPLPEGFIRKVLVKLSRTVEVLIKGRFRPWRKRDRIPASGRPGWPGRHRKHHPEDFLT